MSDRFRDALFLLLAGYAVQYAATGRRQPLELVFVLSLAFVWARWAE
jgi:hypothetical protein